MQNKNLNEISEKFEMPFYLAGDQIHVRSRYFRQTKGKYVF